MNTLIQETQMDNWPIEKFSTTKKLSIPTVMQQIKPVVLVKYGYEYRENLKYFLWNSGLSGY